MNKILSWFMLPRKTVIFSRLQKLWEYTQYFNLNDLPDIHIVEDDNEYVVFQFESSLGTVQVKIENNMYIKSSFDLSYANYAGTTVFEIHACKYDTKVLPMLGEDLTAHDIDLALYEIEDYLFVNLPELEDQKRMLLAERLRVEKLHAQQVKELENA